MISRSSQKNAESDLLIYYKEQYTDNLHKTKYSSISQTLFFETPDNLNQKSTPSLFKHYIFTLDSLNQFSFPLSLFTQAISVAQLDAIFVTLRVATSKSHM